MNPHPQNPEPRTPNPELRTVIVTGAAGFIGRQLLAALAGTGRRIVAVDARPAPEGPERGLSWIRSDLSDPADLFRQAGGAHSLVHLAWDMRRDPAFASHAAHVRNLAGLLDAGAGAGLTQVVCMGSAEEYGARGGILSEEDAAVPPLSPYGWGKAAARELCRQWALRTGGSVAWLRPFVVYGPGQAGDMLIPYAVDHARRGEPAAFSDGNQCRDFLHVRDLTQAILRAIEADLEGFECFNLGRGEPVRVVDVIRRIGSLSGRENLFHVGARPRRTADPDLKIANPRKAADRLGWSARIGWEEGIEEIMGGC